MMPIGFYWVSDIPDKPGWWWYWDEGEDGPIVLNVFDYYGELYAGRRGKIIEGAGYWQGPIAVPPKPQPLISTKGRNQE